MRILVVNSGSSSLKLRILDDDDVVAHADMAAVTDRTSEAVREAISRLGSFDAVGHRIVHGGRQYSAPTRIDPNVRRDLEALVPLAPLHQIAALRVVDVVTSIDPNAPAVACFDTAFHARMPPKAATYAIPVQWRDEFAIRKYGFHGLAHAWTSRRAADMLGESSPSSRIVTCHLGAGASLAAVVDGHGVDTTMGFTPVDGLVMATRSGSIDPGLVLWLQLQAGLTAEQISDGLEHQSGLVGLAGTADMRVVLERADADASLAIDVYVHHLIAGISAMTASAGGLDALVFSGGVGEQAAPIRLRVASGLGFLDVTIDSDSNRSAQPDCEITGAGRVRSFVIAAREDLEIARGVRSALAD